MSNNIPNDLVDKIIQDNKGEIKKISVKHRNNQTDLIIFFKSGKEQYTCLTDKKYVYHLSTKSIEILKSIVSKQQKVLINCAIGYYDSGRDYLIFLYDLVTLCWFLDNLSEDFESLTNMDNGDRELLHNRLVSQLAFQLNEKYGDIKSEENFNGRHPDLFTNTTHIEIKTVLSLVLSKEDYVTFYDDFERQFNKAKGQISNNGMIIIGFWSKRINNELQEYFSDKLTSHIHDVKKNITIIVLDGNTPLRDRYVVIPTDFVLELIKDYCENGHEKINPVAYLNTMMRTGFPYSIRGTDPSHISFMMKMG